MSQKLIRVRAAASLLAFLWLISAVRLAVAQQAGNSAVAPKTERLPASKVKEGKEKITLFKVYKVAKWDLGRPNTYAHTPTQGEELIVLRFYREPVTPGEEIRRHAVTLLDVNDRPLHRVESLWRGAVGAWSEWVFTGKAGVQLKTAIINEMPFDLKGLVIPSEALPLQE